MEEGIVVICISGQAGTIIQNISDELWVLLRNGDIWTGSVKMVRFPQDQADLDACPINIDRL